MGDSLLVGIGDEVLITVCCGAVITFVAGMLTFTRLQNSMSQPDSETTPGIPHRSYDNGVCPICIGPHRLAVETNCGHKFCGPCLRNYLHDQMPGDYLVFNSCLTCPMCRQNVTIMLLSFTAEEVSSTELEDERAVIERSVHRYNMHFGNGPHNWWSYIRDCPVLIRHMLVEFFSVGGVMLMFRVRVMVCFLAAVLYLLLPSDIIPEAVFGFFGLLDDLFIILVCALYVSIIYRRFIISTGLNSNDSDTEL